MCLNKISNGAFSLAAAGKVASIYMHASDYPGMIRAGKNLQSDFSKAMNGAKVQWQRIANLGRTLSSVAALLKRQREVKLSGTAGKFYDRSKIYFFEVAKVRMYRLFSRTNS